MGRCMIHHTGIGSSAEGVIKGNKVYLKEKDKTYPLENMFMVREECEGGLIQLEIHGKWGFAEIYTGQIVIDPVWDYAGPFYAGYAHVALGVQLELHHGYDMEMQDGKHGYIGTNGEVIIPLEYEDALDIPVINHKYFKVSKNRKWGLIDVHNKIAIPFQWDCLEINYKKNLIFCGKKEACGLHVGTMDSLVATIFNIEPEPTCDHKIKWQAYDMDFNLIVSPGN